MNETQDPLVSICCITYNHEKYIRDAIEGFLMQETDFPYEIIIHDDASTDKTADIIREYETKYPDLIKPIYQTENQYSKGCKIYLKFIYPRAKGKYIAFCEGDDYWTDPLKLQKQITAMEKHPECYISFHPSVRDFVDENRSDEVFGFHSETNEIFEIDDVILGDGGFMPTNSVVINSCVIPRIVSFFNIAAEAPLGDYYIQILGAENGGALYLNDVMAVYRSGIPGSWSKKIKDDPKYWEYYLCSFLACNVKMDTFTGNKYSKLFNQINKRIYSGVIRSWSLDIDIKINIIKGDVGNIDIKDWIMWNILFKHSFIVNAHRKLIQCAHKKQ